MSVIHTKILKFIGKCLFASIFLVAGVGHFVSPDFFVKIMPPHVPFTANSSF